MWFLDSLKHLHQMFKGSRKIDSNFFVVKLPKEWSSQNYFCFRPCRNVYFYSSMVFCFKQSFIKRSIEFRKNKVSRSMWFCEGRTTTLSYRERYFQKALSISPLLDECCFVFQYAFWEWPHFHIECLFEKWGVIIISWTWICGKKP